MTTLELSFVKFNPSVSENCTDTSNIYDISCYFFNKPKSVKIILKYNFKSILNKNLALTSELGFELKVSKELNVISNMGKIMLVQDVC